ncbi:twin-arginine translocation signal domain-containing protein [Halobaculum sp. MBLA0147]|uniref:twin-arginine translocation signal domain-containing protein n=1 Tax=Halobaculum sp. MBLA0147 TaxID=3079934 RepID=UPI003526089B
MVTRRGFLAAVGAGGAAGLAGCSGVGGGSDGGDNSLIAYLRIVNRDDTAHDVHVLVERRGDPVHWSTHPLAAGGNEGNTRRIAGSWTETPASYTVYVRLDDAEEWQQFDIGKQGVTCYGIEARVDEDADLSLWFRETPDDCENLSSSTRTRTATES